MKAETLDCDYTTHSCVIPFKETSNRNELIPLVWVTISVTAERLLAFNHLNAELDPICHLLVLLGDLMFMGPCILSIFQYISNKM